MTPTSQFAHPDLDSLNAFVENALPAQERESVLAHLATCSRCRQITYLAQSAVEEDAINEPVPQMVEPAKSKRRRWFTGFGLGSRRLVILAGACTALAAFTIISLPKHKVVLAPQQEAKNNPVLNPVPSPAPNTVQSEMKAVMPEHSKSAATVRPSVSAVSRSGAEQRTVVLPPQVPMLSRQESLGEVAGNAYKSVSPPAPQPIPSTTVGSDTETVEVSQLPSSLQPAPQPQLQQTISVAQIETMDANVASKPTPAAAKPAPSRTAGMGGQGFGRARGGIATYGTNHAVGAPQTTASATFYSRAASVNDELLAGKAMQTLLPTGSHPTIAVAARQRVVAIDPKGSLYLSQNAGVLWLPVTQQWTGRATSLRIFMPQLVSGKTPVASDKITSSGASNAPVPDANVPKQFFELTTDRGALWFSEDGTTWKPRDKP
ncbi:anti-sigma factor family protein [Acidicapsa dinghuensis]|uniref:Anti-sigma factor family protein n=1 Tax=Acidicapsa dinghuensis TaxID=2218256 RepID=A0ABW1EB13_9BACT|nr:zf-HC2 domain-containing protein [Acidicapsa dinghuensis]